ncbi:MAG: anaerobic magnesium-protoporphyrin monomethyl ester cyclase [Thermodesulfobacteriota bacterium]|nr:anaerobic magnesium-protoporphyrin monomethyl ester cyclase [Thermodesulfobacteriota bacterium]
MGLAYIAAALEREGIEVKILDLVVFPYSRRLLESVLKDFAPHIVGTTAVTMTFDNAIGVIRDVKNIDPSITTVMGGPHVTFCAKETMSLFPELDFIVLGEGEETITELAGAVDEDGDVSGIEGIVFRGKSGIVDNGPRKSHIDVDSLPFPARHLLPLGRYRSLGMPVSMTTSRGCPFKCIFCAGRKMVGAKVRYRNPQDVVDEMESLAAFGFRQINIADDLFTSNENHCLKVCDEIIKRGLKLKWTSFARVDTVSVKVLVRMREAGCHTVSFGVESGNREILKRIKKGITPEQVADAVKMCNEAGVSPHASFILGLPGETPETLKETVEFGNMLKEMGVSHGFHLLAPFPGTEIREEKEKFDIKILSDDWRDYHANRAIVETSSVTRKMLDDIAIGWEDKFNGWLGYIRERIKSGEASEEEAWPLVNLERIIIVYDLMMKKVVEEKGCFDIKASCDRTKVLELFAGIAAETDNHKSDEILKVIEYEIGEGNLILTDDDGICALKWIDYL